MKIKRLLLLAAGALIALSSCSRDSDGKSGFGNVNSTDEMQIPEGFDYRTSSTVHFDFTAQSLWGKEKLRLDIYDYKPMAGGEIMTSLFLNGYGHAEGNLEVPAGVKELYAKLTYPDASSTCVKVKIVGNDLTYDFPEKKAVRKTVVASPDCKTGCGTVVSGNQEAYTADNGGVYCFTGNISQSIAASNGSTVRICGTGTFAISAESGASIEIVDDADVTISNLTLKVDAEEFIVYPNANVVVSNWATPNADIVNHGHMSFVNLGINSGCHFTNNGEMEITGTGWYDVLGKFTNNGSAFISGNFIQKTGGELVNNCSMTVSKQLKVDGNFDNFGYVKIDGTLNVHTGAKVQLHYGAMISTQNMTLNGMVEGHGPTSLLKIQDGVQGISAARMMGNLQICDANGIESDYYGQIVAPAQEDCSVYIPVNGCNAEGNGSPTLQDGDFDGIADQLDLYPNDAEVSGASYYPSDKTFATLLFEDLWPGKGDFDFNDLVLGYSHKLVTNAANRVVRVESKFVVKAIGGSLKNGFGFQFDVDPSAIESVTGQLITRNIVSLESNGTERNQSKATIIVFDNAFSGIQGGAGGTQYVNTITTEPTRISDTITIVTTFYNPQTISSLGDGPFNPFIFINGDRGRELHLVNHPPTDLIKEKYFMSSSDFSDPSTGQYYKSEAGHPWALNVKDDVEHMQEKLDIVQGYSYFANWAQSGGQQSEDWYIDHAGYRNDANLF